MAYRIRDGVVLVTIKNVNLIVTSAPYWDICPYITQTNEMGALIWNQLEMCKDKQDIVDCILEEYETDDITRINNDVDLFIQKMIDSNYLIEERNDTNEK